jgi:hypothetical protein
MPRFTARAAASGYVDVVRALLASGAETDATAAGEHVIPPSQQVGVGG